MNIDSIIAKVISHPWIVALLALTFVACNFVAWLRIRRENRKDYRRPHSPKD